MTDLQLAYQEARDAGNGHHRAIAIVAYDTGLTPRDISTALERAPDRMGATNITVDPTTREST
jgi:hypothetical protein